MKKQITLFAVVLLLGFGAATAQEKQMSPADKAAIVVREKLTTLNLGEDVNAKTKLVLKDYYTNYDNAMSALRAGGTVDRDVLKAKRKELNDARDKKLRILFTVDQFRRWKQEIEPTLRPNRAPEDELNAD